MMFVWFSVVILFLGKSHVLWAAKPEVDDVVLSTAPEILVEEYSPKSKSSLIWSQVPSSECGVQSLDGSRRRNHKVLIFLDSGYADVFHNWYLHYTTVCGDSQEVLDRLAIVCIDKDASEVLSPFHLSCAPEFSAELQTAMPKAFEEILRNKQQLVSHRSRKIVRHVIWMKRLEIVSVLLQRGEDVLLSDLDAIWLRNPYPDITSHLQSGSSVISSRATYPEEISRVWGRSLCMGFVYLRADKFTQQLLSLTLEHMGESLFYYKAYRSFRRTGSHLYKDHAMNRTVLFDLGWYDARPSKEPDDQYSINHVLQSMSAHWPSDMKHPDSAKAYTGHVEINATTYNITLLPEHSYVRHCSDLVIYRRRLILPYPTVELRAKVYDKVSVSTVAHCLISTIDAKKKQGYLVYYHLYALPYNATDVNAWLHRDAMAMRLSKRKQIDSRELMEKWSLSKINEGNSRPPPNYSRLQGPTDLHKMNSSALLNLRKRQMSLDNRVVDDRDRAFLKAPKRSKVKPQYRVAS